MGLVACRDCGVAVSPEAPVCPYCGRPRKRKRRAVGRQWVFGAVAVLALTFAWIVSVVGSANDKARESARRQSERQRAGNTAAVKPATPPVGRPLDARTQWATAGPLTIWVESATVAPLPLNRGRVTVEDFTIIRLRLRNTSPTTKVDYRGWLAADLPIFGSLPDAELTDDFGNKYTHHWRGNFSDGFPGDYDKDAIYPGDDVTDLVIFQRPVKTAGVVYLTLDLKQAGSSGRPKFAIPIPLTR